MKDRSGIRGVVGRIKPTPESEPGEIAGVAAAAVAAAEVAAEVVRWLTHLGAERRMSPKTVEAYQRDVRQFLAFLTGHFAHPVSLKDLAALEPRDVRAFMAERRRAGIGSRSLMRTLAGARSFA